MRDISLSLLWFLGNHGTTSEDGILQNANYGLSELEDFEGITLNYAVN